MARTVRQTRTRVVDADYCSFYERVHRKCEALVKTEMVAKQLEKERSCDERIQLPVEELARPENPKDPPLWLDGILELLREPHIGRTGGAAIGPDIYSFCKQVQELTAERVKAEMLAPLEARLCPDTERVVAEFMDIPDARFPAASELRLKTKNAILEFEITMNSAMDELVKEILKKASTASARGATRLVVPGYCSDKYYDRGGKLEQCTCNAPPREVPAFQNLGHLRFHHDAADEGHKALWLSRSALREIFGGPEREQMVGQLEAAGFTVDWEERHRTYPPSQQANLPSLDASEARVDDLILSW